MFKILTTDKVFFDSPDTGHPECLCSRCGKLIPENEMAIRAWPSEPGDYGYDPNASAGTEFRYHFGCLPEVLSSGKIPDEDLW